MQATPVAIRKTPKVIIDDLLPGRELLVRLSYLVLVVKVAATSRFARDVVAPEAKSRRGE
jgi:hypothetical protein